MNSIAGVAESLNACVTRALESTDDINADVQAIVSALKEGVSLAGVVAHEKTKELLVSEDDKIRAQATKTLALILADETYVIEPHVCQNLCTFFSARLGDFPSVPGALDALINLINFHTAADAAPGVDVHAIFESIFSQLHVPGLGQPIRHRVFTLMKVALSKPSIVHALAPNSASFIDGTIQCMEGERDPRCLIQCFELVDDLYDKFPSDVSSFVERIYDVTACYFPLSFVPPPNDPFGIKPEALSQTLETTLCGHEAILEFSIPFFIDKLSSTVVLAKVDSLKALHRCITSYDMQHIRQYLETLSHQLYLNATGGTDLQVTQLTNKTITALCAQLEPADWQTFYSAVLERTSGEVIRNIDGVMAHSSMAALIAIARGGADAFRRVLAALMPNLLLRCRDIHTDVQMQLTQPFRRNLDAQFSWTALQFVGDLLGCIDVATDFKMTKRGSPLSPYIDDLTFILRAAFTDVVISLGELKPHPLAQGAHKISKVVLLCTQCAEKLLVRPPSPLVPDQDAKDIISSLCHICAHDGVATSVHEAILQALFGILKADLSYREHISATLIEPQLQQLTIGDQGQATINVGAAVVDTLSKLLQDEQVLMSYLTRILNAVLLSDGKLSISPASVALLDILQAALTDGNIDQSVLELLANSSSTSSRSPLAALVSGLHQSCSETSSDEKDSANLIKRVAHIVRAAVSYADGELQDRLVDEAIRPLHSEDQSTFLPALVHVICAVLSVMDKQSALLAQPDWLSQLMSLTWGYATLDAMNNDPTVPEAARQCVALLANKVALVTNSANILSHLVSQVPKTSLPMISQRVHEEVLTKILSDDQENKVAYIRLFAWVFKGVAMRADAASHSSELVQKLVQIFTGDAALPSNKGDMPELLAYAMQDVLPDHPFILVAVGRCRTSLLWKQKLFNQIFKPLFTSFKSGQAPSPTACLIVLCTISGIVPKSVLSNDLVNVTTVVIQAMAALNKSEHAITAHQRESITSRALETLQILLENSRDAMTPHLHTVIPVLLSSAKEAATAKSRGAALSCLLLLSQLPYAVLHPYKQQVLVSLRGPLDDCKKPVRRLAAKARNEWSVVGFISS